jgi:hypothetical protein
MLGSATTASTDGDNGYGYLRSEPWGVSPFTPGARPAQRGAPSASLAPASRDCTVSGQAAALCHDACVSTLAAHSRSRRRVTLVAMVGGAVLVVYLVRLLAMGHTGGGAQ